MKGHGLSGPLGSQLVYTSLLFFSWCASKGILVKQCMSWALNGMGKSRMSIKTAPGRLFQER